MTLSSLAPGQSQEQALVTAVSCMADLDSHIPIKILDNYGIRIEWLDDGATIDGSFWGEPEAGIVGTSVYVRRDTPVHSFLHESSHIICMAPASRDALEGNAGSDDLEESAVCYLQILLANGLPGIGQARLMADMNAWGYSFRLGSAERWFAEDADDARRWLLHYGIIDGIDRPTFRLRGS